MRTPQSFADPDSAAEGLRELHAAYELDARQEQRMSTTLETFRRGFDDLSPTERDGMNKGFDQGLARVMPARQKVATTEKAWADAVDDAYAFARAPEHLLLAHEVHDPQEDPKLRYPRQYPDKGQPSVKVYRPAENVCRLAENAKLLRDDACSQWTQ